MKDFKNYRKSIVKLEEIVGQINEALERDIIKEGLANFYNFVKANSAEGFVFHKDQDSLTLCIERTPSLSMKEDFSCAWITNLHYPHNLIMLEDKIRKLERTLKFLLFLEETMMGSED